MTADDQKRAAAAAALDFVEDGMRLGLGTGSTAAHFVRLLGEKVRAGLNVVGVPTSKATEALAKEAGIRLTTLDETPELDLCVDGADEIDDDLNLIKGGGGALLREKIVAYAAKTFVVIADRSKLSPTLGGFRLPLEVLTFGAGATVGAIARTASGIGPRGAIEQRLVKGKPYLTDNGNWIFDADWRTIEHPARLAEALSQIPGMVEHGLFVGMADHAVISGHGGVEILSRSGRSAL